jgi:RNA polymerase sigma-70 factor (ECF subfamily)
MESGDYEVLRQKLKIAVRSICPNWLRDRQDDLVQAGMMAVMRIDRKDEEERTFHASYLRKVAYSAMVDEIRRLRSRKEVPLDTMGESRAVMPAKGLDPGQQLEGRQIGVAIRRCLDKLIEPRRLAVTLHLLGYKQPQIAERMGWTHKRASNLVFRGLQNLRACLSAMEVTP